jgi:hypothetical protein
MEAFKIESERVMSREGTPSSKYRKAVPAAQKTTVRPFIP